MTTTSREFQLASRPQGMPTDHDFRTVERELPEPTDGQVLVRNTWLSVDPYMRGRMNDVKSYVEPFALDAPMDGGAIGVVEASGVDGLSPGDTVQHMAGWRSHALLPAAAVRQVDESAAPAQAYLGALGMPGMTAYVGLTRIAELGEGETVFVSGAAGAVGSMVGQIAKQLGAARVIGSAGSPEKVTWLTDELGFDAAFDYHDGPVGKQLAGLLGSGGGIDVFFDNVGGEHLEGALFHMAEFGRIAICGAIASYNDEAPAPGPRNLMLTITKRLTIRGFIVSDHAEATAEFYRIVVPWLASGELSYRETVVDGLDRTLEAFLGLYSGANTGKMLVRL